jgi:hypothetical protein
MIKEAFSTYLLVKPSYDGKLSDAFLSTLCFSELNFSYFPDTILIRETKFLYLTYFCLNFAILRFSEVSHAYGVYKGNTNQRRKQV